MKLRVIALLLGVCMISTLVAGCGNSKNKEIEKENINEAEVVTEIESELGTEIESELTEKVQTETTESQNTETKVEDTTSSELKENKSSSDKGQSNNQQQNNNLSSSDETWINGRGEVVSTNPALCSHSLGYAIGDDSRIERQIVKTYDTGAYDYINITICDNAYCTWCGADLGYYESSTEHAVVYTCYDNVTDYIGEFKRAGSVNEFYNLSDMNQQRAERGLEPMTYFVVEDVEEVGGELVEYSLGVSTHVGTSIHGYYEVLSYGGIPSRETLNSTWYSSQFTEICVLVYRTEVLYILR